MHETQNEPLSLHGCALPVVEMCFDEECLKDCFMAAPPKAQPQFKPQATMVCKKSGPSPIAAAGAALMGGISHAAAAATSFFGAPTSAAQFEGARMQSGMVCSECCCEPSAWQGDIGFKTGKRHSCRCQECICP